MDVVGNARALQTKLRSRAAEIEQARRLPADLSRAFAEAGFYRLGIPKTYGGLEVDPATLFEVISLLAEADASAGWCAMIGSTTGVAAAYLDQPAARDIFGDPTGLSGGVFAPMGRASAGETGFQLTGRWSWASNAANCQWLMGGSTILEDGQPRRRPDGSIETRMLIFPAAEAMLFDTWYAMGLSGTGSGEMAVEDLTVPLDYSVDLVGGLPKVAGALYAFPVFGLLALGIAAVALGNARGALDDFAALAGAKTPQGSRRLLAERATVQAAFATAEAQLAAARAFHADAVGTAWSHAQQAGALDLPTRARLRLAATHAVRTAADITAAMQDLAGGSAVFLSTSLQRRFRDARVATSHLMIAPATLELTGKVLLGLDIDGAQL